MSRVILVFLALAGFQPPVQIPPPDAKTQAAVRFAQQTVLKALDYSQGDRRSLVDAQEDFTPDGWREFMKWMEEWIDDKGAPLSSSRFMPSGDPVIADRDSGRIHLTIPGTLQQKRSNSSTTYRVMIDVRLTGEPPRIAHMEARIQVRPRATTETRPPKAVSWIEDR